MWVPAQSGMADNKIAEQLAKKSLRIKLTEPEPRPGIPKDAVRSAMDNGLELCPGQTHADLLALIKIQLKAVTYVSITWT